jgi:hypothetical protein
VLLLEPRSKVGTNPALVVPLLLSCDANLENADAGSRRDPRGAAARSDNQIVLRSNGEPEVIRSFGEDLKKNVADELKARPKPGDTKH